MARTLKRLLKRWRDNYFISSVLSCSLKPLQLVCSVTGRKIQQSVRKNGVSIRLPNGRKMSIGKNAGIAFSSLLFWHGLDGHEPETSRTLRFFFERASTFIDVGANWGFYSLLGALWNPTLKIIAFEPVPAIFSGLQRNVRLNRVEGRVRCENLALSGKSGRATFFLPKSEDLDIESSGTLTDSGWQATQGSPLILDVEALRFDEYEAHHPMRVDVIKIDVEDFEADVLEGMQEVIRRDQPFIVCEVLPRAHRNRRTRETVEALNYQAYWITSAGYIRVPNFDFSRNQFTDFLLSPVSTSDVVLSTLEVLWELKKANRTDMDNEGTASC